MEDLSGKQLGPYQVVAPLGEGGMAAVYKAYQPSMDRYVALKILPRYFASDPQFVGRFEREAKVIAKLQHPHILPVFDYGEEDGYTYIVMPFVEGGTLADSLRGQPLTLTQIQRVIAQIGDALDYAYSQGVVHRDVKPSNVLIDPSGNCLLTDFGIAKIVEGTAQFTRAGGTFGTPAYMSPEQIEGEKLDGRSDVYSLGVVLYEMATSRPPFRAETPPAIFVKHLLDPPPPPRTLNPALPEAVERVTLKALAKDREERYATAGDMARELWAATGAAALSVDSSEVPDEAVGAVIVGEKPSITRAEPPTPATGIATQKTVAGLPALPFALGTGAILVVCLIALSIIGTRLFTVIELKQESISATQTSLADSLAVQGIDPPAPLPTATHTSTHTSVPMPTERVVALTPMALPATDTPTSVPTADTPTPPSTTPLPTGSARATALANAVLVFEDDFSSNANNWWEGEYSDETGDKVEQIIDGKFRKSVVSKQSAWNWSWVPDFSVKDFWLSVEVTVVEASGDPGDAQVAITFRENENDEYYEVEFANDNTYSVWLAQDDDWSRLQKWTPSDAVKMEPGVTNTFALLVMGSSFTLYVNEQELNTVTDTALGEAGQISLTIGLERAGQILTVEFDNLVIKELPD